MARTDPPNPYKDLRLGELAEALMARAGDLLGDKKVGRRDTTYMLIAAGHMVRPEAGFLSSPATLAKTDPNAAADRFIEIFEEERVALRAWLVAHAYDVFCGGAGMLDHDIGGLWRVRERALVSDEACIEVVREIAARAGQLSKLTKSRPNDAP